MDCYHSSHDRITRWLICDLRYTELFASHTLYLISRARIEVASSTFSFLFLLFFFFFSFFFVLFIQSERCTLDRPARFLSSVLASFRNQHSPLCTTVHRLFINGNVLQHCLGKKFFLLASSRKRRKWFPRVTFCYSVGYQPPGLYKGFMQGASLEAIRPVIS